MFNAAFPIISTADLPRALGFYQRLLDARVTYQFPGDGTPVYVSVEIGSSVLGLGHDPRAAGQEHQRFALWVDAENCDEAIARLRKAGVRVAEEPADQPWGERVARVLDPDGNVIVLGSKVATKT